jgi:hypothetical protein
MILVRRIAKRNMKKYDLFQFITETHAGYPVSSFTDIEALRTYLHNTMIMSGDYEACVLLSESVFMEDNEIWLFAIDTVLKETRLIRVDVEAKLSFTVTKEYDNV